MVLVLFIYLFLNFPFSRLTSGGLLSELWVVGCVGTWGFSLLASFRVECEEFLDLLGFVVSDV